MTHTVHTIDHIKAGYRKYQTLAILCALVTVTAALFAALSGLQLTQLRDIQPPAALASPPPPAREPAPATPDPRIIALEKELHTAGQALSEAQRQLATERDNTRRLMERISGLERQLTAATARALQQVEKTPAPAPAPAPAPSPAPPKPAPAPVASPVPAQPPSVPPQPATEQPPAASPQTTAPDTPLPSEGASPPAPETPAQVIEPTPAPSAPPPEAPAPQSVAPTTAPMPNPTLDETVPQAPAPDAARTQPPQETQVEEAIVEESLRPGGTEG
ncbi:MAG: hypothetical protein KFF50_09095 [Desulfatitalea sp.]|nr:hypothetical protein [Desulfatitalea sp.]